MYELTVVMISEGGHGPKPKVSYHVFDTYEQANQAASRWAKANPLMSVRVWRL
jgi:hypothetical protein